jgi:hypothetical protein
MCMQQLTAARHCSCLADRVVAAIVATAARSDGTALGVPQTHATGPANHHFSSGGVGVSDKHACVGFFKLQRGICPCIRPAAHGRKHSQSVLHRVVLYQGFCFVIVVAVQECRPGATYGRNIPVHSTCITAIRAWSAAPTR